MNLHQLSWNKQNLMLMLRLLMEVRKEMAFLKPLRLINKPSEVDTDTIAHLAHTDSWIPTTVKVNAYLALTKDAPNQSDVEGVAALAHFKKGYIEFDTPKIGISISQTNH